MWKTEKEEWEKVSLQLLCSISTWSEIIDYDGKASIQWHQWFGADPSVQHHLGWSRVLSINDGNGKSLRVFKFFPIASYSLRHDGKVKCGFWNVYFWDRNCAVPEQHVIDVLSVILTTNRTHWGITWHDFFTERVGDNSPTEVYHIKRCLLSGSSLTNLPVVNSQGSQRSTVFASAYALCGESFNSYRKWSLIWLKLLWVRLPATIYAITKFRSIWKLAITQ